MSNRALNQADIKIKHGKISIMGQGNYYCPLLGVRIDTFVALAELLQYYQVLKNAVSFNPNF